MTATICAHSQFDAPEPKGRDRSLGVLPSERAEQSPCSPRFFGRSSASILCRVGRIPSCRFKDLVPAHQEVVARSRPQPLSDRARRTATAAALSRHGLTWCFSCRWLTRRGLLSESESAGDERDVAELSTSVCRRSGAQSTLAAEPGGSLKQSYASS
jgi:hypothetical protein